LRQKATQLLLLAAFVCELVLWVRRVDYGALLLAYGLWAYTHTGREHLSVFCALTLFSLATDSLSLAADDGAELLVPVTTWLLVACKTSAVAMLVYWRDAFS